VFARSTQNAGVPARHGDFASRLNNPGSFPKPAAYTLI